MTIKVDLLKKKSDGPMVTMENDDLESNFKEGFVGHVFKKRQELVMIFKSSTVLQVTLCVDSFEHASIGGGPATYSEYGQITSGTTCNFEKV